jgi:hypothetical protein
MVVDGLAKELKKSNLSPLLRMMKTGRLRLTAEAEEVEARAPVFEKNDCRCRGTKAKLRTCRNATPPKDVDRLCRRCRKQAFARV